MSEQASVRFIYWFAYYNLDSPSVRYRAFYPLQYFQTKLGREYYLVIPGYSVHRICYFLRAFLSALLFRKKNSIIVIQRVHSNFIYANLLKLLLVFRKKQSIYDLDDADYIDFDPKNIYALVKRVEHVSCGSKLIKQHLQKINSKAFHLTSPIVDLGMVKNGRNKKFTVGWIGGYDWGHKESLNELLFPALAGLSKEVKFVLMGCERQKSKDEVLNYFRKLSHIELVLVENIDWQNEEYLQSCIQKFDVGIATLSDNELRRSKSGIKAKQYLNNGVPVICNNLPENNRVIKQNYNGFVCQTADEFKEKIEQLIEMDQEEYSSLSQSAFQSSKAYSHASFFETLFKSISDKSCNHRHSNFF